jgi:hypothetical protein
MANGDRRHVWGSAVDAKTLSASEYWLAAAAQSPRVVLRE